MGDNCANLPNDETMDFLDGSSEMELQNIIDVEEIQLIMDDFHHLTKMATAIIDLNGKVIEATGWQDICTKFHRINPLTSSNCTASDLFLAKNLKAGEIVDYKCQNGLWDVVTPLFVAGRHIGNIFTGQFFYDDEVIDESFFREQAQKFNFDEEAYMDAFRRVPRYSREKVQNLMNFLVKFAAYISRMSLMNLQLKKEIQIRHQVENALNENEIHLRTLLKTIPDLVWLKDPQGYFCFCNSRFESFLGYAEKDIIGKSDYDFLDSELADFFTKHDSEAAKSGKPCTIEREIIFADGHSEILEIISSPMFMKSGQISGILSIGHDITAHKLAEMKLRSSELKIRELNLGLEKKVQQRTAQLESSNKELESFAYIASHDLQEPLRKVQAFSDRLKTRYASVLDEKGLDYLTRMEASGKRMQKMVNDLLAFSRVKTRGESFESVNLNDIVDNAIADVEIHAIECGASFEIAALPVVEADPMQMQQLFMNLISNGIKFHRENVPPVIKIYSNASSINQDQDNFCEIVIEDNGIGFEIQYLDRIFKPFQRLHGRGKFEGTGIGLSICQRIIERHRGCISAISEIGIGSKFIFTLPILNVKRSEI
ncbi:MAG: hypothetical protein CVV64_20195 [Candidatus Wallbacteria bacterium HGW-Wallbacteria-1]|jgi:PAS domain S-box-containing protein|uniref:histidine kinase n=1 Tax=Candidatus Wallbacteria bacterium HGW-Wallbacteria-1 TaxID=2013854 RepID=A0A2N1PIH9_9BACT|nr:MAG: hypothetical protein CVV64_20195 [Candidatus Wallbacteria bacterium HGW-Wallbacteria-1]